MRMAFKNTSKVSLKNYFEITEEKKFKFYPFNFKIKKIKDLKKGESNGIYSIFFKNKLVYIGRHNGNENVVTRWEKHLKSLTSRFLPINFVGAKKENIKGKPKFYKFYKDLTFNKLLDFYIKLRKKKLNFEHDKIEKIIKDHIDDKKKELIRKYSNIYKDFKNHEIFKFLTSVNVKNEKKIIQLLTNEGSNSTPNRLLFSLKYWNIFKNRNCENILDDFEAIYFKYNGLKLSKKHFEEKYELKAISEFSPIANDEKDKGKINNYNVKSEKILKFLNE